MFSRSQPHRYFEFQTGCVVFFGFVSLLKSTVRRMSSFTVRNRMFEGWGPGASARITYFSSLEPSCDFLKSSILGAIGNDQKCKIEIVNIRRGNKSESLEFDFNISLKTCFRLILPRNFEILFFRFLADRARSGISYRTRVGTRIVTLSRRL